MMEIEHVILISIGCMVLGFLLGFLYPAPQSVVFGPFESEREAREFADRIEDLMDEAFDKVDAAFDEVDEVFTRVRSEKRRFRGQRKGGGAE